MTYHLVKKLKSGSHGISSLAITLIEHVITRTPMSRWPADEFIEILLIGSMHDQVGIGRRLDHASPSRFKRHSQTLLVKITTDQGLIGWGEAHAPAVHAKVITDLLALILIGQDARRIDPLWDKMYSSQRLRGHATVFFTESIAGVDIALWDILENSLEYRSINYSAGNIAIVYPPIALPAVPKQRWRRALQRSRWGFPRASAPKILHGLRNVSEAVGARG